MLLDADERNLVVRAARGLDPSRVATAQPKTKGIAGWVLQRGEPVLLNHLTRLDPLVDYTEHDKSIFSSICVPLRRGGRIDGLLCVNSFTRDRLFDQDDLELAELFSYQASMALALARPGEQLNGTKPR
jgi:GAF domain-containing protein